VRSVNNLDISNPENFVLAILKKVGKYTFAILDVHQRDKVEEDIEYEGDGELRNTWGLYYRLPSDEDIKLYHAVLLTERENNAALTNELAFSPKHQSLRASAADKIKKKADAVQKTALKKSPNTAFKEGDIVLIPLDVLDHTKVDGASITRVIVKINGNKYTVAVKEGVLKRAYMYHRLGAVPEPSNNLEVMDLEEVCWMERTP
jgi:hypothetical protein